jgi:DNA-binding transcriptional regulator YhcF (GntR family)
MSFRLVKSVISSERVDGMHKLVLVILADYVNDTKGNAAWPSVTTIAIKAGASVRHTRRIIRELEIQGVLKTVRQAGLKGTNKYVIDLSGADTHVRGGEDIYDTKGGHMEHQRADTHVRRIDKEQITTNTFGAGAGSARAPDPSLEISTEETGDAARPKARDAPKCQEHSEVVIQCATCYYWQHHEWRKDPQ